MKNLILSALVIGAASQAAGCIIVADDDDTGDAQVTWDLLSADAQGNTIAAGCPAGADTAKIFALLDGAQVGDAFIDKHDCADGGGFASDLPEGQYLIWVQLTDFAENTIFAESGSLITNIVAGATTPVDHSIYVDHGFYSLSWTLDPPGAPNNFNCSQIVGERGVSIVASTGGGGPLDEIADCEAGLSPAIHTMLPLPSNLSGQQYTMSVTLIDTATPPNVLGVAPTIPGSPDTALYYGNEFVDLGTVNIAVN
jgi:hypothetical protein